MKLLAIDPSINATGAAFFQDGELISVETLKSPCRGDRVSYILAEVDRRIQQWDPDTAAIEACGSWTRRGTNVKSLLKLSYVTGALFGLCNLRGLPVEFVGVREWTGGRSKVERMRDVGLLYGIQPQDDHQADAIGIGHYVLSEQKISRMAG